MPVGSGKAWHLRREQRRLTVKDTSPQPDKSVAEYNEYRDLVLRTWRTARPKELAASYEADVFDGMKAFSAWVARGIVKASRRTRQESYIRGGKQCLHDLLSALRSGQRPSKDYVLVSIDAEGDVNKKINQLGFSCLETKQVFENTGLLKTYDQHCRTVRGKTSIFSATEWIALDKIGQVFQSVFESYDDIVLVGHALWASEVGMMDKYGVAIESFTNIVGTIDTERLDWPGCGASLSLSNLIAATGTPYRRGSIHCAGNDAHYTLRVLLAFLLKQLEDAEVTPEASRRIGAMEELFSRPLPAPVAKDTTFRFGENAWEKGIDGDLDAGFLLGL